MSRWRNLGDLVDRAGDLSATAVIDLRDPTAPGWWSHGALDRAASACAERLVGRGHRRGDRIAILSANRAEYLIAVFGILRAGMIAVPVSFKLPPATIEFVLRDAGASLVLCDGERRASCPPGLPVVELADLDQGRQREGIHPMGEPLRDDSRIGRGPADVVTPAPSDIALILYTSGSTGRPKGVPLTHAGQLWAIASRVEATPDLAHERLLVAAPFYHMNALCVSALGLAGSASVVLLPQFGARAYVEAAARYRCTWLTSVPTMMALVVREGELLARSDLSSVRRVSMGSAPLTQALVDKVRAVFPGAALNNGYGTTETGPVSFGPHPDGRARPDLALGYPAAGVDARLVAGENLDADHGVLQLRTPALMPGYLNLPERTAQVMTADGYYVTGDVMRRDADGFYYFVGRADDMFVCGGENIYPGEVERMLEAHAEVHQACVVPVPDEVRGDKPVAFVVPVAGARLTAQAVKEWALAHAPAYQHPRHVELVAALPLAGTGKIDRRALMTRAAEIDREMLVAAGAAARAGDPA